MADPYRREGQGRDLTHPAIEALLAERDELRRQRLSGLDSVHGLSRAMDVALSSLWSEASGDNGVALVALGGYGRGELSPRSDVDLVFLYRGRKKPEELTKRVLYALWDAGFEVGHATRTVKDSLKLAAENHEAHTSFLSARHVAGDGDLFAEFAGAASATPLLSLIHI